VDTVADGSFGEDEVDVRLTCTPSTAVHARVAGVNAQRHVDVCQALYRKMLKQSRLNIFGVLGTLLFTGVGFSLLYCEVSVGFVKLHSLFLLYLCIGFLLFLF
jgi:hypothetical protein